MKSRRRTKWSAAAITLSLLILSLLMLMGDSSASAVSTGGPAALSVSPLVDDLTVDPGQTVVRNLRLTSLSDNPRTITAIAQNFVVRGDNGQADPTSAVTPYELAPWLNVVPITAALGPHDQKLFQITITVPKNATPGSHFGSIVFSPQASNQAGASVQVIGQISSLILVTVRGQFTERTSLMSFSPLRGFYQHGPVSFVGRFVNQGNVEAQPQGKISISNAFGQQLTTVDLETQRVLPNSIRRISAVWKHRTLLGKYHAKLVWHYGTDPTVYTATTSFWAFPVNQFLVLVSIVAGGLVLFWLPRARLKRALKALVTKE